MMNQSKLSASEEDKRLVNNLMAISRLSLTIGSCKKNCVGSIVTVNIHCISMDRPIFFFWDLRAIETPAR